MGGSRAIGSLEKQVCIWLYNTCLTHVIASDVIPVTRKTSCKYGMLITETACFLNNKNVLYEGISLRHSILNKEMFFCKTPVIDQLTAKRDRIYMFFK